MARFELLSADQHQDLRLIAQGETPHFTSVITSEFFEAANSLPIMLTKNSETGEFFAVVILSMKSGEPPIKNLAQRGGFVPLSLQCQGFYISDQQIAIDRDNPRFSSTEGEALFTASRQPAECLRKVQHTLGKLHIGQEQNQAFIKAMTENQLIEPVDLDFSFEKGERISLKGLYSISLDSLHQLDDAKVIEFFRSGYMQLAYLVAGSLKQFNSLAHMRNQALLSKTETT
ncbi:hypothetical protein GCM10011613_31600 [Cellvibrio zantedeschiae]|uniref:Multidrug transporter n=1 Tax=Cellvibrio zantedeschiae TaxID=1237077 RepID=A0ABQ3BCU7_9GAMM|nr:SapC family protein [Cellvibrio zantedeschiae]GGY84353.1 hypothetical protein GCM10011613_31600 [Cellvibrio zantedeschiae]